LEHRPEAPVKGPEESQVPEGVQKGRREMGQKVRGQDKASRRKEKGRKDRKEARKMGQEAPVERVEGDEGKGEGAKKEEKETLGGKADQGRKRAEVRQERNKNPHRQEEATSIKGLGSPPEEIPGASEEAVEIEPVQEEEIEVGL
jgi:hypothetical protein